MQLLEVFDIAREWSLFEGAGTELLKFTLYTAFMLLVVMFQKEKKPVPPKNFWPTTD